MQEDDLVAVQGVHCHGCRPLAILEAVAVDIWRKLILWSVTSEGLLIALVHNWISYVWQFTEQFNVHFSVCYFVFYMQI